MQPFFRLFLSVLWVASSTTAARAEEIGASWRTVFPKVEQAGFSSIAAGPEGLVAVRGGQVCLSGDGESWRPVDSAFAMTAAAYGAAGYVAVGPKGAIRFSRSGYAWQQVPAGTNRNLLRVVWSGEAYVAISDGAILRSVNGVDWSEAAAPAGAVLRDLFVMGNSLCVVGRLGRVVTSADHGVSWSEVTSGTTLDFKSGVAVTGGALLGTVDGADQSSVIYWKTAEGFLPADTTLKAPIGEIDGTMLAVPNAGVDLVASTDGVTWTPFEAARALGQPVGMAPLGDSQVIVGAEGKTLIAEPGFSYNSYAAAFSLQSVISVEAKCYAVGHSGAVFVSETSSGWWKSSSVGANRLWRASVSRGQDWVAVGREGQAARMQLGFPGSVLVDPSKPDLHGVATSATDYVAVGKGGVIFRSPTGQTWEAVTSGISGDLYGIAHANGRFTAVGAAGVILRSTDGVTWEVAAQDGADLHGIAYLNGEWVAVGQGGTIRVSTDGDTWQTRASGSTRTLRALARQGTRTYVVGEGGTVLSSPDHQNWRTLQAPRGTVYDLTGVAVHKGQLLISGSLGLFEDQIANSASKGKIYTAVVPRQFRKIDPAGDLATVDTFGNLVIAAGADGKVRTSRDGRSWTTSRIPNGGDIADLRSNGSICVAGGPDGLYFSTDAITWQPAVVGRRQDAQYRWETLPTSINRIIWANNQWVACGALSLLTSQDGRTWQEPFRNALTLITYDAITYGVGKYVTAVDFGRLFASANLVDWEWNTPSYNGGTRNVEWTGGNFVSTAVGNAPTLISANGLAWTGGAPCPTVGGSRLRRVNGLTFAPGPKERISSTLTGTAWRTHSLGPDPTSGTSRAYTDLTFFKGSYVAVGTGGLISTSKDGDQWTYEEGAVAPVFTRVASMGGRFVALSDRSGVLSSPDGARWTLHRPGDYPGEPLRDLAWSGSHAVIVGDTVLRSSDLDKWTESPLPAGVTLDRVAWNGSRFIAYGGGRTYASDTGATWTETSSAGGTAEAICATPAMSLILTSTTLLTSPDGITWTSRPAVFGWQGDYDSLAWDGGRFIATGTAAYAAFSPDGITWTVSVGNRHQIRSITRVPGGLLARAEGDYEIVRSTNALTWTPLHTATQITDLAVTGNYWLAVHSNGRVSRSEAMAFPPLHVDLASEGISGDLSPAADVNGDGIGNLLARYFGIPVGSPTTEADRLRLPALTPDAATGTRLKFSLPPNVPSYLELRIERSGDLSHWNEIARRPVSGIWTGTQAASEIRGATGREVEITLDPPAAGAPPRFFRARVVDAP